MDLIDNKTDDVLLATMIEEAAKARNEINCASRDIEKAQKRLTFVLLLANRLKERQDEFERFGKKTHPGENHNR